MNGLERRRIQAMALLPRFQLPGRKCASFRIHDPINPRRPCIATGLAFVPLHQKAPLGTPGLAHILLPGRMI
jgi:hypothetical protein